MTLENQIIFEIAMGIGNELDLQLMLRHSLSIYLRRLNCTSGVVLEKQENEAGVRLVPVFSIPRRAYNRMTTNREIRALTGEMEAADYRKRLGLLPRIVENGGKRRLILLDLEGYGILILEKTDGILENKLIRSLLPVNDKLARACLLSRQTGIIHQKNEELKREIRQRIEAEEARKTLEHQVLQTQKLESLGVLAGGIAHDFNNLLMGILCNADIALMDVEENSEASGCITTIKKISRQASGLCDQILLYSGKATLQKEPLVLADLILGMEDLIATSVSRKVAIEYHFEHDLPEIVGDSGQLRQVVLNLLTNAAEAIGSDSGTIKVHLDAVTLMEDDSGRFYFENEFEPGRYLRFRVRDSGVGMDPSVRERIFEPFYTTKFSGRGLGLASVLGVVRSHGGIIEVKSEPGDGACFMIYFPVSSAPDETKSAPAEHIPAAEGTSSEETILVVDDEFIIASLVARMLRKMGYAVDVSTEPESALATVRDNPAKYDLVIMDMQMPHMDGVELFAAIRELNPQIRGVLSSGYYEADLDDSIQRSGFIAFLHKPYEIDILRKTVRQALSGS